MKPTEIETFFAVWNSEAEKTANLIASIPADRYDFRPDPGGRSLGELAWHLAEADGHMSMGVAQGSFDFSQRIPGLERPREVAALAPGYRRVHEDAMARLRHLTREDLDRTLSFMPGLTFTVREVLWDFIIHHNIHHRGQLSVLCRLAGGRPPGIYGPNREEWAAMQEQAKRA